MLGRGAKRVLVVEDDPDIVELITHSLEREGFRVEALGSGRSCPAWPPS
jgi:DNA-binding response OmpR family regulator